MVYIYSHVPGVWDSLLEFRIKLQKAVIIVNQLPQPDVWNNFVEAGEDEYQKALKDGRYSCETSWYLFYSADVIGY